MTQAIVTRYFGPGNVKGSRVKAAASAGSITLQWDDALNSSQNHTAAARALAKKLDWTGTWYSGGLPDGCVVWVLVDQFVHKDDMFTIEANAVAV